MTKELRQAIEQETNAFCAAEQTFQQRKGQLGAKYDDASLHARVSNCGAATAFVQQRLQENHDISTERLYGVSSLAPRSQHGNRSFGHVILRHENTLIDPTYGQLFAFAGIHPRQPEVTASDYPRELALMVDVAQSDDALAPLARAIDEASRHEYAQDNYSPLRGVGAVAIQAVLRDVYAPSNYTQRVYDNDDPLYDRVQTLLSIDNAQR